MDANGSRSVGVQGGDVVVVGGGLAGLTAAVLAARHGARVTILEARSTPGGRARSTTHDGFVLNDGPHALYVDGEAKATLELLGIDPAGWVPPASGSAALVGGRLGVLPVGPTTLLRTPVLGWRGRVEAGRLLSALPRLDASSLSGRTVDDWLGGAVGDGAARQLVRALVRTATYCDAGDHLDAGAALRQVQRTLAGGVRYLDGGWQVLVDRLLDVALDLGVAVERSAKVEHVRAVPGGGVAVDRSGGPPLRAAAVVVAGLSPGAATAILGGAGAALGRVAARAVPSTVTGLDVCLDVPWGAHPRFVLGMDEPLYLSVHGPGAALVPPGGTLVSLLRYHRPGDADGGTATSERLEAMLDAVRPGWRAHVVHQRTLRRALVAHDVPGAASGGLAGRPSVDASGVPGVLLAGDWVGGAGLLSDAAVASGAEAGRRAAELAMAVREVA